ncbi:MAG: glycosyltransferase family 39 protein [Deltaproteobacteria bacterium]|nr:glycosyltransferase family 39 protein [Deltaproteobacteria bacterium]
MRSQGGFREIFAIAAWLWLGGVLLYAAGIAGALGQATLVFLAVVIGGGLVVLAARSPASRRAVSAAVRAHPLPAVALAAAAAIPLYLGLSPPVARDALIHHLALPRLFLDAGRIVDVPFALHAAYPQGTDMLYLLPVGLGADWTSGWIHLGFGILASAVLGMRARRWAGDRAGLLAAALFLGLPVVARLAGSAYVDLAFCLYVFLAMEAFLRWREAGCTGPWLAMAGLAAGFALSSKYQALLVIALLGVMVLLSAVRRGGILRGAQAACLFGLLALLPPSPWLAQNAWAHHNPVYPLFSHQIGDAAGDAAESAGPLLLRRLQYGESNLEIAALPFRIFLSGRENDPRRFDGRLNPFLPLLAAAVLLLRRRGATLSGAGLLTAFAVAGVFLALGTQVARARYVLPFVALLCPLAGAAAVRWRAPAARALLACALIWNGFFGLRAAWEADLFSYVAGSESREAYLVRRLPAYPLYASVNALVPKEGRVQLLFMGDQGYYLDVPYIYEPYFSGVGLARALAAGPDGAADYFRDQGVTHFLVNETLLRRFLDGRRGSGGSAGFEAFANAWTTRLDGRGAWSLYEIDNMKPDQEVMAGKAVKIAPETADEWTRGG